tara:strand:+ start:1198 stop:2286 length:1089 start_codon:yes stop_codon:yes gene_type:complete
MAISADAAEAQRRQMTQAVAAQGSRGYETQAATVQPSKDVAAAAQRSILAAPVDMTDGQRSALATGTDELAGSAELYADAQRQIFKTGQDSALAAGNTAYDGFSTLAEAQNFQLDRYRQQLADNYAARNRGSGGPVDPLGDPDLGFFGKGAYEYLSSVPEIAEFGANHSFLNPELWSGETDDKNLNPQIGRFVGPNGSFTMESTVDERIEAMAAEDGPMASYLQPDFAYGAQWDAMTGDGGGFAASIAQSGIPANEFPYHVTEALVADGVPRTHARIMAAQIAMAYVPVYQSVEPDYVPQTYESVYSRPTTTTPESMFTGGRWDAQARNDESRRNSPVRSVTGGPARAVGVQEYGPNDPRNR